MTKHQQVVPDWRAPWPQPETARPHKRVEANPSEGHESCASGAVAMRAIPVVEEQLDSRDLFAVARVITIAHGGQTYQLRLTSQNKLILTK